MARFTENRNYPTPDENAVPPESGTAAFLIIQSALDALDIDIDDILSALALKSAVGHHHIIADVDGLASALAGKMAVDKQFKLDDLTDVDGADAAPIGYVLVKTPDGWIAQSALAAVGDHDHTIAQVVGLATELAARQLTSEKGQASGYASLDGSGKVPTTQVPTSIVGATMAGGSGVATPADGDRFAGVLAGGSTVFWSTWANIKTAINALIATATGGTMAGRAYPRRSDGTAINIQWSGQGGQPSYLIGSNDGVSFPVYNPSNFNVNAVGGWTQAAIANNDEVRGQAWAQYAINNVMPTIASQLAGAVGTFALLYYTGGTAKGPGDGASGAELVYSAANPQTGPGVSGSWRCMGYCIAGTGGQRTTLWLRYA